VSPANSLYEACRGLFKTYPQAAKAVDDGVWSIVIMLGEGPNAGYFVVWQDCGKGKPAYSFWRWPVGDVVEIVDESVDPCVELLEDVLSHGIPIPRDGSVFGWASESAVTALIVIYVESVADRREPGWAVMPCVGVPEEQWPSFTGEPLFGHWSWEGCPSGRIVSLDEAIGRASETVWWVDTSAVIGSNCCVVSHDIVLPDGDTLPRGRYVYYQALRSDETIPSLEALLGDTRKIDLAPRLQNYLASGMMAGGCRN
jgi:hypothetical protein